MDRPQAGHNVWLPGDGERGGSGVRAVGMAEVY
jgi:hypothetical protein